MGHVGADEGDVRLCEGCTNLRLEARLLARALDDSPLPASIRLSPSRCSLCALINRRLLRHESPTDTSNAPAEDSKTVIPDTVVVFCRATSDNARGGLVRRLKIYVSGSDSSFLPRVPVAEFWPATYPVPTTTIMSEVAVEAPQRDVAPAAASRFPSARLIDQFVDLRLLHRWMQLCDTQHGDTCAQPLWLLSDDAVPPDFRLVDVLDRCVVIVDSDFDSPVPVSRPSYFALSYVWGPSTNDLRATSATIEDLKKPHSLTDDVLPRTLADAMRLVHDLGGRYLWVDRLCILQDDEVDKARQIPRMDSVYSLAQLTIVAASGSGAHDGVAGLSVARTVEQDVCRISRAMALMTFPTRNAYESSVYSHRGWTLQERVLSRRSLMFTEGQAIWSCLCATWAERLCLEPSHSAAPGDSPWRVSRTPLGSFERVPAKHFRDFTQNHYRSLPRLYASREFTDESDALDAISGLLRRMARVVAGVEFHWGHLVADSSFDQSLSWRKTSMKTERRDAMCPLRSDVGALHSVPFPSWSWLGWKAPIKHAIPPVDTTLKPEIEFFRLDVDGRAQRLVPRVTEAEQDAVDQPASSANEVSSGWKGEGKINLGCFTIDRPFRDSGKLLFWTSHAELSMRASPEEKARPGCVRLQICSPAGLTVGHITESTAADDHGRAWPFIEFDGSALHSFVVISRKHEWATGQHSGMRASAEAAPRALGVMWIKWEDGEKKTTASRISVGEVDEHAWINVKRDWRRVVLQ